VPQQGDSVTDLHTPIVLGQTGLRASRLGIGSSFTGDERFIEEAVDQGVNYLYWGSIRRPAFGRAIRNVTRRDRSRVVVTVQSYSRVAALLAPSIEIALRRTGLEHFDFLLLGMWNRPPFPALVDAAQRLKARGLVRHLMMSTHNRPSLQAHFREFERGESPFDAFMLRYNAVHRGAEQDVFPHLPAARKPAILAYTATRWGHLCDPAKMPAGESPPPARDCYRFALSNPSVDMVLCGPRNREQMQEALRALDAGPLAPDERERLARIGDHIYGRYRPQFAEGGDRRAN
jgi:aryl-alcohol dehydrogenase-like predicted oxidoreductase